MPPIVWADQYSLPYNDFPADAAMWQMAPLVIFGYEPEQNTVHMADRAALPLTATIEAIGAARGRVKQDKYRLATLDMPDDDRLASAVSAGIWSCIKLFIEKPPKGSPNNFGFAAYERWTELLKRPKQRMSWEREFPAGRKMLAALTSTFNRIALFGQDGRAMDAERGLYADFLEEAAVILNRPRLAEVAPEFHQSAQAWRQLAYMLLPDSVPPLREIRELMLEQHRALIEQGEQSLDRRRAIRARLSALQEEMTDNFPLSESEVRDLRAELAKQVLEIHDIEQNAIAQVRYAMK